MKEIKKLERLAESLKSVSTIISGVSSLLPWIKKLVMVVRDIFQPYHWPHHLIPKG